MSPFGRDHWGKSPTDVSPNGLGIQRPQAVTEDFRQASLVSRLSAATTELPPGSGFKGCLGRLSVKALASRPLRAPVVVRASAPGTFSQDRPDSAVSVSVSDVPMQSCLVTASSHRVPSAIDVREPATSSSTSVDVHPNATTVLGRA